MTTVAKTGSPLTTVLAGRRYVIQFTMNDLVAYPNASIQPYTVLYGTTVKYTCDAPCVQ